MSAVDNQVTRDGGTFFVDGRKVRALRHARRWSQLQLARETGRAVTQSAISDIENSAEYRARLDTAAVLARALGVSIDDLLADPVPVGDLVLKQGVAGGGGGLGAWAPLQPVTMVGRVPVPAGEPLRSEGSTMWVQSALVARSGRLVGVHIDDDSCEPHAPAGHTAVVNLDLPWTDGAYHLLDWQGERVLRRVLVAANLIRVVDPRTGEPSAFADARKATLHGVVVVWLWGGAKAAL